MTITREVHFGTGHHGRKVLRNGVKEEQEARMAIPRVSRLMALALEMERLVAEGEVESYATLAELSYVSRPRMTQVMNLLNLAPDIQEEILFLSRTGSGRDPICERMLRPIAAEPDWRKQRRMWEKVKGIAE